MTEGKTNPIFLLPVENIKFEIPTRSHATGMWNTGAVYKFRDCRPISGYIWETIQDRITDTTEW